MSQYIEFFVKNGGKMAPIGTYSGHSAIFQSFKHGAPWGKARVLNDEDLGRAREMCSELIENNERCIADNEEQRKQIALFNNSVEDKLEAIYDVQRLNEEAREELADLQYAKHFISFLSNILDDARDSRYYENPSVHLDAANYIYFGIECGLDPEII